MEAAHIERPGPKLKKKFAVAAVAGLIFSLTGKTPAHDEKKRPEKTGEKIERSLPVDPQVTVTLCVASGVLKVRGWDSNEVRVRSVGAAQIEFRRLDRDREPSKPASRVDVVVLDKATKPNSRLECRAIADIEMELPAGATVQVQTRDGNIFIAGVAGAYAGSQNGNITIERATKLVEAGSVGGSILLKDSGGRVNLSSAGGGIEVMNVHAVSEEDTFEVGTVSGDIQLDQVSNRKVMVKTVNGKVSMSGALVKSGYYAFTNVTGDVLLTLPSDASFRLHAKISEKRKIISEFPLKYLGETPHPPPPTPKPPSSGEKTAAVAPYVPRRIEALYGSGDATISVASFGGIVRLKKL